MSDDVTPATPLMRRDIQAMLTYIQGARIVNLARETEISRFQGWLVERFVLGLAIAVLALLLINGWEALPLWGRGHAALLSAIVLLTVSSRCGAIVSIGRRMRSDNLGIGNDTDSITTLGAMGSGRNGLALALFSANVFGLVMFALLASGLPAVIGLTGGIVPSFSAVEDDRLHAQVGRAATEAIAAKMKLDECRASFPAPRPSASPALAIPSAASATPAASPGPFATATPSLAPAPSPAGSPTPSTKGVTGSARVACDGYDKQFQTATTLAAAAQRDWAEMRDARSERHPAGDRWLDDLRVALGLATVPDLFKLLLLAFIAGFFEQLVPDMLDRIKAQTKKLP